MKIIIRKFKTYSHIVWNEMKCFKRHANNFGIKLAVIQFIDGILIPNKRPIYIKIIEKYVTSFFKDSIKEYNDISLETNNNILKKFPIWVCWWQGEKTMPDIVSMCYTRLKDKVPEFAELHLITFDNYLEYIELPKHIIKKFKDGIITMTTMSDILRMCLLNKYGGYWVDATVFFTGDIPQEYFKRDFYCQKMYDPVVHKREACKGRWCGFSIAGTNNNVLFKFMKDGFFEWWKYYNDIPDYVLIDYMILVAYKNINAVKKSIDSVENNNEDIFEMYKYLNEPYSKELYDQLTKRNVMHKLTYKMDLKKTTNDDKETLYGHLYNEVFGDKYE